MIANSVFKEQIVKRKPTTMDALKRVGLIVAVLVITVLAFAVIPAIAPFIMIAAGIGAWFCMGYLRKEYEYAFTDGELDIDVIYNRSRRKRVFTAKVNDFEIMAHVEDKMRTSEFQSAVEVYDYSSGEVNNDTYAFLLNYKGKRTKFIIEPNAVMLKAMATVLTRRRLHLKP